MEKVKVLFVIAVILVAVSAHPLEENDSAEKKSSLKAVPGKASEAQKIQNETDSSESSEPAYIEETYIEVIVPNFPQLNATELEAILNKTANDTDDSVRSKRSVDSDEDSKESSSSENISPPSKGGTVPAVLYTSRNSNTKSASSEESSENNSKESTSSTKVPVSSTSYNSTSRRVREAVENNEDAKNKDTDGKASQSQSTPVSDRPLYSAHNYYSRPAREDNSDSESSSINNKKPAPQPGSQNQGQQSYLSNNQRSTPSSSGNPGTALYSTGYSNVRKVRQVVNSSEGNTYPPSKGSSVPAALYTLRNSNTESARGGYENASEESSDGKSKDASSGRRVPVLYTSSNSSSRQVREAVDNNDNEGSKNKDTTEVKTQQSQSSSPVSAQDDDSRPAGQGNSGSGSSRTKGQQSYLSNNQRSTPSSSGNPAPALYSSGYSNVRKVRELVDSSVDE